MDNHNAYKKQLGELKTIVRGKNNKNSNEKHIVVNNSHVETPPLITKTSMNISSNSMASLFDRNNKGGPLIQKLEMYKKAEGKILHSTFITKS